MDDKIREAFIEELSCQYQYEVAGQRESVDIIVIVHDQLDYVKKCVETIYANTENFTLYIWDNASQEPTAKYLQQLAAEKTNVILECHPENLGFIKPNNRMAERGTSPWIILLNSDTEVYKGWDTAMIGWLKAKPHYAQVGYVGGLLEPNGQGGKGLSGGLVDYIAGWCFCVHRDTFKQNGLFDEDNLEFAYAEDADLSLRLLEKGHRIYALHLGLVIHHGNATINVVRKERDCNSTFEKNHDYIRKRWAKYIRYSRMMVKNPQLMFDPLGLA